MGRYSPPYLIPALLLRHVLFLPRFLIVVDTKQVALSRYIIFVWVAELVLLFLAQIVKKGGGHSRHCRAKKPCGFFTECTKTVRVKLVQQVPQMSTNNTPSQFPYFYCCGSAEWSGEVSAAGFQITLPPLLVMAKVSLALLTPGYSLKPLYNPSGVYSILSAVF